MMTILVIIAAILHILATIFAITLYANLKKDKIPRREINKKLPLMIIPILGPVFVAILITVLQVYYDEFK